LEAGSVPSEETEFAIAGERALADLSGALVLPDRRALVVADLHLEKGSGLAARGTLLPPWDSAATLDRLAVAIGRWAPRLVIALGDSFHDEGGVARLSPADRFKLGSLQSGRDWIWVAGNHDPAPPRELGGWSGARFHLGALVFRHEPTPDEPLGQIAGHLHPVARVVTRKGSTRRRCFVTDGARCVLPAYGAYAGGLNLLDSAYDGLFRSGRRIAHVLGRSRVYAIHERFCAAG
jgi:hypothetical protein